MIGGMITPPGNVVEDPRFTGALVCPGPLVTPPGLTFVPVMGTDADSGEFSVDAGWGALEIAVSALKPCEFDDPDLPVGVTVSKVLAVTPVVHGEPPECVVPYVGLCGGEDSAPLLCVWPGCVGRVDGN